jgi:predicted transcriptional regulator
VTDNFYFLTDKGVYVFNMTLNMTASYEFTLPIIVSYPHWDGVLECDEIHTSVNGICVQEQMGLVLIALDKPNLLMQLDLNSGNFSIIQNSVEAGLMGVGLNYGEIITINPALPPYTLSTAGMIDGTIQLVPDFPTTGTLGDVLYVEEKDILICVTGFFQRDPGSWTWSSDFTRGLIIIDMKDRSNRSYCHKEGVPGSFFNNLVYDPNQERIYVSGESFFFYVDLKDLEEPTEAVCPEFIQFNFTQRAENADVLGFEGKKETISIIPFMISAVLGIVISYGYVEPFKFKIASLFGGFPLFTKLREDKILDNENRARIMDLIKETPGIHYTKIKDELNMNNGTISYHLSVLMREERIISRNRGARKLFFPSGMEPNINYRNIRNMEKEILKIIEHNPGINQFDLSKRMGRNPSTIHYNIQKMQNGELIRVIKKGGSTYLFFNQN